MYDYEALKSDITKLNPVAAEVFSIGKSVMGRELFCIKIGRGIKKAVLTGAHHGLEYITSKFLMKFLNDYCLHAINGSLMFTHDVKNMFTDITLYSVPMMNPDGVDIAVNGLDITNKFHRNLISKTGIHSFRKVWQSNARGVDLNHNYNALWHKTIEKPAPSLYGGEIPESEPETAALCKFIRDTDPDMLICFHSQGKEIYYDFDGMAEMSSYEIANKMSEISGYKTTSTQGTASYGGCKDWFIKEFSKPGFTVEMGLGKNPLPTENIEEIYTENSLIILTGLEELKKERCPEHSY